MKIEYIGAIYVILIVVLLTGMYLIQEDKDTTPENRIDSCNFGCNMMYDQINYIQYLDRYVTNSLLVQCIDDCEFRFRK